MDKQQEKRSYYRIRDCIGLSCARLDGADDGSARDRNGRAMVDATGTAATTGCDLDLPLSSVLGEIDRKFNRLVNSLWLEHPPIAEALGLLNRKLAVVAAQVLREEGRASESYEEALVSLSGSGMGFDSPEPYPEGTRLRLCLALTPSCVRLELTGVVAGCEAVVGAARPQHWVRVAFESGNEAAQEQLIQHVVQRQCAQIHDSVGADRT